MIVHTPETSICDDEICVSTRVETSYPQPNLPEQLWFRFPAQYQPYLNDFSDGFAASLLLLAMYLNEPFQVRGPISSKLAYGLSEWAKVFNIWLPNELKIVDLDFLNLQQHLALEKKGAVCTAFSGGFDSLHTLWFHLPQNQPLQAAQATHALFIHGFDIRLHNPQKYQALSQRFSTELDKLGITLLNARTNAFLFYQFRVKWETSHAGPLIGTALVLGNLISRFYIPSSNEYTGLAGELDGTSPLTDHMLSTETTEIVHFGSAFTRNQKIKTIKDWPVTQNILHVCIETDRTTDANNCGRCIKCLVNMIRLEIYGVLPKYKTFHHTFKTWEIFRMAIIVDIYLSLNYSLFKLALKARRFDLAIPLFLVLLWNSLRKIFVTIPFHYINKKISRENRYKLRRLLFRRQEEYPAETISTLK